MAKKVLTALFLSISLLLPGVAHANDNDYWISAYLVERKENLETQRLLSSVMWDMTGKDFYREYGNKLTESIDLFNKVVKEMGMPELVIEG